MGRAYPTMYHGEFLAGSFGHWVGKLLILLNIVTFSVYGQSLVPCVLTDARNNVNVVMVC